VLDTVRLSRRLFPELGRHDLASLCATHRIRRAIAHRALEDARATAELLRILLERARESGLTPAELRILGRPGRWRRGRRLRPITLRPEERARLQDAAVVGDAVALGYLSQRGNRRLLTVVPYAVDPTREVPRLVAYDVAAGRTRIWPLDRVVSVAEVEDRP
jgi:hypothetical protein